MNAWSSPDAAPAPTPTLPILAEAVITRATKLSRPEIDELDRLDAHQRQALIISWDLLRDATTGPFDRAVRLAAGDRAWRAALVSLERFGLVAADHDYWRATQIPGSGACRAARFAACAAAAPIGTDPDVVERLRRLWVEVIGDAR